MPRPGFAVLVVTTLLSLGNLAGARAEPVPAPSSPLRDYEVKGIVQIDIPSSGKIGDRGFDPGVNLWFPIRQQFVWPDRQLIQLLAAGSVQSTLVQGNVERSYSPGGSYIVQRIYKNLEAAESSPITALQLSLSTFAKVLGDLKSGRTLPAEDLEKLKTSNEARIAELEQARARVREQLSVDSRPEDLRKFNEISSEMVRLRDDINQIPVRKKHPCTLVEFDNKDLTQVLLAKGLMGARGATLLSKGTTRFWITQAEGLPIKMETTDDQGHVALYFSYTDVKINTGLKVSEVALYAPPDARMITVTADLRDPNWEDQMNKALSAQVQAIEDEKDALLHPKRANALKPAAPGKEKKRKN
jgi:hypothetical protein